MFTVYQVHVLGQRRFFFEQLLCLFIEIIRARPYAWTAGDVGVKGLRIFQKSIDCKQTGKRSAIEDSKWNSAVIFFDKGHQFFGLYNGLRFVFSEWEFPEDRRAEAGLDEIKQHFSQIANKYGYKSIVPADILISLGYRSIRQAKLTEAIEALLLACELHPYSPDAFYYLGEAYEKNNQIDLALKNYKKALEVDSSYLIADKKIQSLEKKKK